VTPLQTQEILDCATQVVGSLNRHAAGQQVWALHGSGLAAKVMVTSADGARLAEFGVVDFLQQAHGLLTGKGLAS